MKPFDSVPVTGLSPKGFFTGTGQTGREFFCLYTDIGETVSGEAFRKKRKNYLRADEIEKAPSPFRILPPCPSFTQCGGCDLQHLSIVREEELKTEIASTLLKGPPERQISSPFTYGYRNNMEFTYTSDATGLHRKLSRRLLDIPQCSLAETSINEALASFRSRSPKGEGEIRFISTDHGVLERIYPKYQSKETDIGQLIYGTKTVDDIIYHVSPDTFFQSNDSILPLWLNALLEWAREVASPADSCLDLYCGSGTITLKLASFFNRVTGIEGNPLSLFLFEKSRKANGLSSREIHFIQGDLFTHDLKRVSGDLLVVNPPRGGLSALVKSFIREKNFPYILYSSCNVQTFARDLAELPSYRLEKYLILNMFPRTFHFEIVGRLKLKED